MIDLVAYFSLLPILLFVASWNHGEGTLFKLLFGLDWAHFDSPSKGKIGSHL